MPDPDYFHHRRGVITKLMTNDGPVLDVGCGAGAVCADLAARGVRVVGVELDEAAAQEARDRYADVHCGTFEDFRTTERFRQVVLADVLEHMADPYSALRRVVTELLQPNGRVIVSLPNVRHWRVVYDLLLRGRWEYVDQGILDRTHLRFFTDVEARRMIEASGAALESAELKMGDRVARLAPPVVTRRIGGLLAYQLVYSATKPS